MHDTVDGQTTAEQQMKVTLYNQTAEREGFVVLYPEVDEARSSLPGPLNHCWRFEQPSAYFRDQSDAAAIADMTRAAFREGRGALVSASRSILYAQKDKKYAHLSDWKQAVEQAVLDMKRDVSQFITSGAPAVR